MPSKTKKSNKPSNSNHLLIQENDSWKNITAAERKRIDKFGDEYRGFISTVKTEREANDEGVALAEAHGFRNLDDIMAKGERLKPGVKAYATIKGKTLILFHIGKRPITEGMRIVGGHTDSPRLDLKPRPLYEEGGMALLDTHYYGGIKKYQWVALPLALHGVVVRKDGTKITLNIGENPDDPVFTITDLLPHLGQQQGEKKLREGITGEGLNVLFGSHSTGKKQDSGDGIKVKVLEILHKKYGFDEADLTSAELELVPAGPARDLGIDRSMILAYGHDDRVSAYTAIRGLLDLKRTPEYTALCILCDKEEIGSVGATGMNSFLFENVMAEVVNLAVDDYNDLALRRCLKYSKMLSADVNALHDPNYPEVSSPNKNMARINKGLVLTKYCGSRGKSGSNDASAEFMAEVRRIFDDAGVVWQTGELGKVDQGGGGTISYMLARYEMEVVDCGVGVLSMHAPYEVAAKLDTYMAYKGYKAFYQSK
jgi:aspartyl aminopeptidase